MNVTSIYKKLEKVLGEAASIQKLENVVDLLYREVGMKVQFCKINGKRWSYLAGHPDFLFFEVRVSLNERLGIMVEEILIPRDEWDAILVLLKKKL